MSKDFIWAFHDEALASGFGGPFSLEYHVPALKLTVAPDTLVGSKIWLVIKRGGENFLYAVLTPSIIELYQEGRYKDDFLLLCQPFSSVRFLPRVESVNPWRLPFEGDESIRECTEAERMAFLEMMDKNRRVGFTPPARSILDSIPRSTFSDLEHAVPDQLMSVLRTVSFGDVSRSRSWPNSISAIGGVAFTLIKSSHANFDETEVVNLIAALDPLSITDKKEPLKTSGDLLGVLSSLPPMVDTFLEEIDPEKISPRTFVAKSFSSDSEWLNKTNDAEKAHEQILKDLVLYLKGKGFKVYKTRSFDLFAEKGDVRFLWEVKSANGMNSVSQGEKGVVQLLRYSAALADAKWNNVKFFLLLQDSGQRSVHQYLSKIANRAGAELWLYDEMHAWPKRVFNLELVTIPSS